MLKKIFLILSVGLSGCNQRPVPLDFVYVVDVQSSFCVQYQILDKQTMTVKRVKDLPLVVCDGNVSIAKEDWLGLKDWIIWAMTKVKQHRAE